MGVPRAPYQRGDTTAPVVHNANIYLAPETSTVFNCSFMTLSINIQSVALRTANKPLLTSG